MRVVAAEVILLGIIVMQISARRKVKFADFDIGWQFARQPVLFVVEVRVIAKNTFDHRFEESLFEQTFPFRFIEG